MAEVSPRHGGGDTIRHLQDAETGRPFQMRDDPRGGRVLWIWILPLIFLVWWLSETRDIPWSLIDHGEYFWRTREIRASAARGDLGDVASLLAERRHPFDVPLGRLRPVLWIYVAIVSTAAELIPAAFNAAGAIVFAAGVALVGKIVWRVTRSLPISMAAQCGLALVPTSAAMWLRVGCHEPVMILLGGGAAVIAAGTPPGAAPGVVRRRAVAASVLLLLCVLTKETSVHLAPSLVAAWWWFGRDPAAPERSRVVRATAITGLVGIASFLLTYAFVVGGRDRGAYSAGYSFTPQVFADTARLLGTWVFSDFGPLVIVVPVSVLLRWRAERGRGGLSESTRLSLCLGVECAAYLAIYLPWSNLPDRVLPGFSFSFVILAANEVRAWMSDLRGPGSVTRVAARLAVATAIFAVSRSVTDAPLASHREATRLRARYACDAALVDHLALRVPPGGSVCFDLLERQKELGVGAVLHLRLFRDRSDVSARISGIGESPVGCALIADFQGAESEAGRAARLPGAQPVVIRRVGEVEFWSVWNVLRSVWRLVRTGDWPGVPIAASTYEWRVWPASGTK